MSFTSVEYFVFLLATLVFYTALPKKAKWCVLLVASVIFYAINSRLLTLWLVVACVVIYVVARLLTSLSDKCKLERKQADKENKKIIKKKYDKKKKATVTVGVVAIFGMLVGIKYINFLGETAFGIATLFGAKATFTPLQIVLPLGISYYSLCAVSYIVDVYRGKYQAEKNFFKLALYLSFFPQMVEGPIGKYDVIGERLFEGHEYDYDRHVRSAFRMFWGLFKKLVIADRANIFVSSVFDGDKVADGSMVLVATLLYTIQIYCEFSGCMDIVMGSGELFGVELQENFRRPVFSKTINEFWQRWHITLGVWIKEYIFFSVSLSKPLMNLSKKTRKKLNDYFANLVPMSTALLFVWLFNGFWHGASWKYVLYGLYYYILMMIGMYCRPVTDKFISALKINTQSKPYAVFQMVRTFVIVNVGMMLFRAHDIGQWLAMLKNIFVSFNAINFSNGVMLTQGNDIQDFVAIIIGTLTVFVVELIQEKGIDIRVTLAKKNIALRYAVFLALIVVVFVFGAYGDNYLTVAPIYGQF